MFQLELFNRMTKGWNCIGNGCYGRVYEKPDGEWVWKKARSDGTRTYLEWVLVKQQKGEAMLGMPEVDFVVPVVGSALEEYIVAMRKYEKVRGRLSEFGWELTIYGSEPDHSLHERPGCPQYLKDLILAFEKETYIPANDIHTGNIMVVPGSNLLVLTDPSSASYSPLGASWKNELQEFALH